MGVDSTSGVPFGRLQLAEESPPEFVELAQRLIVTVAAWKGGVGKSETAKELAWLFGGVLVDFDWDAGGVTASWGYIQNKHRNTPLLDALHAGRVPRPLSGGPFRADLVPSSPDFGVNQPAAAHLTDELVRWQGEWQRPVVVDTHPGGCESTFGAIAAADVVVVPAPLKVKELNATKSMLEELRGYPLLLVPMMVPPVPPAREIETLRGFSEQFNVPVLSPVFHASWLPGRTRRMAVCAGEPVPAKHSRYVGEMREVGKDVLAAAIGNQSAEVAS